MRAPGTLRSLRVVSLVLAAFAVAGLYAFSSVRRYPSVSDTPHETVPDAELTTHSLGGGPDGGEIYSLAIVATQPATVFAASWRGGVFKSGDGGASWTPADRGLPQDRTCALVAHPRDRSVLYAECSAGLFKTTDQGTTWQQLDVDYAWRPVIAPSDSRILYEIPNSSIVRSADAGEHWQQVDTSGLTSQTASYVVDPRDRLVLYAGTYDGIFKSRDGGVNWSPLSLGLPSEEAVGALALDPRNENTAFAGTSRGLYKTTTGGKVWRRVGDGLPEAHFEGLVVRGATSELLYAEVDDRLFRSNDGGDHWLPLEGLRARVRGGFVVDPWAQATLFAGTGEGVYVTTDGGAAWRPVNRGISRMSVSDLVFQGGKPSTLFVRGDSGSFSSSDNGTTWRRFDSTEPFDASRAAVEPAPRWRTVELPGGRPLRALAVSPRNSDIAYATSRWAPQREAAVWRTVDGGVMWEQVDICSKAPFAGCHPVADPNDVNTMFVVVEDVTIAGGDTIRATRDGGRTWTEVVPLAEAFFVLPTRPTTLFAQVGDANGGSDLLKSVDWGGHWTRTGEEGRQWDCDITAIVMDPANAKHLFAGTKGRGVFQSLDGGATWRPTAGH